MSSLLLIDINFLVGELSHFKDQQITLEELIVRTYELTSQEPLRFRDQIRIRQALNMIGKTTNDPRTRH